MKTKIVSTVKRSSLASEEFAWARGKSVSLQLLDTVCDVPDSRLQGVFQNALYAGGVCFFQLSYPGTRESWLIQAALVQTLSVL